MKLKREVYDTCFFLVRNMLLAKLRRPPVLTIPLCEKFGTESGETFSGYRWYRNAFPARQIRYNVVVTEVEHRGAVILKTENATRVMKYREFLAGIRYAVHFILLGCS